MNKGKIALLTALTLGLAALPFIPLSPEQVLLGMGLFALVQVAVILHEENDR